MKFYQGVLKLCPGNEISDGRKVEFYSPPLSQKVGGQLKSS